MHIPNLSLSQYGSREFGELKNLQHNLPASGDLPGKEQEVDSVEGNVETSGSFISFLHGWDKSCSKGPQHRNTCEKSPSQHFLKMSLEMM